MNKKPIVLFRDDHESTLTDACNALNLDVLTITCPFEKEANDRDMHAGTVWGYLFAKVPNSLDDALFIGEGIAGFWAACMSTKVDCPCAIINPIVHAYPRDANGLPVFIERLYNKSYGVAMFDTTPYNLHTYAGRMKVVNLSGAERSQIICESLADVIKWHNTYEGH